MTCEDCQTYLFPFLDNALDVKQTFDIQTHLDVCARCADRVEAERALRIFLRKQTSVPPLPDWRKRQIIQNAMGSAPVSKGWRRWNIAAYLRDAAIGTAVAAAVLFLGLRLVSPRPEAPDMVQKLSREVSTTYRTYISQSLPFEMVRSDDGAVVAWVKSRMGTGIHVPWVTENEAQFLGGRLCRILDHKSAVLVYQQNNAKVFLFAFKGDPLPGSIKSTRHAAGHTYYVPTVSGPPVAIWQHEGTTYSLVGNVSQGALVRLAASVDYR